MRRPEKRHIFAAIKSSPAPRSLMVKLPVSAPARLCWRALPLFGVWLLLSHSSFGQSPFLSESIIKYDTATHQTDKPIPFDRAFTLLVDKYPGTQVREALLYETRTRNGRRAVRPTRKGARLLAKNAKAVQKQAASTLVAARKAFVIAQEAARIAAPADLDKANQEVRTKQQAVTKAEQALTEAQQTRSAATRKGAKLLAKKAEAELERAIAILAADSTALVTAQKAAEIATPADLDKANQEVWTKRQAVRKAEQALTAARAVNSAAASNRKRKSRLLDARLPQTPGSGPLQLYFPPIKPNRSFDVLLTTDLPADDYKSLLKINQLILQDKLTDAATSYQALRRKSVDPISQVTTLKAFDPEYLTFFNDSLRAVYDWLDAPLLFEVVSAADALDLADLQAINQASDSLIPYRYSRRGDLEYVLRNGLFVDAQIGRYNIATAFMGKSPDGLLDILARVSNLSANQVLLDSLQRRTTDLIAAGRTEEVVAGTRISLRETSAQLAKTRVAVAANLDLLQKRQKMLRERVGKHQALRYVQSLAGNTNPVDFKTAGGRILYLDAGLANLRVRGTDQRLTSIPRLYSGVSIYFRPIDKNTRRSSFPLSHAGARREMRQKYGLRYAGPSYRLVPRLNLLQHLSLNVGLTLGSIPNKGFDNLYNNMSLLVGPALRVRRAFKVSGGLALLKRTPLNPIESDKKVVRGYYFSTSVDIDFIQGLKDVTTLLFK